MAALNRILSLAARRTFSTTPRAASLMKSGNEHLYPDPIEHATGIEKKQLLAEMAGNTDPFDLNVSKRGAGTKENPNIVLSACHERMVGCICEEDSIAITWMWLRQDEMKRCACGHWFKLQKKEPL